MCGSFCPGHYFKVFAERCRLESLVPVRQHNGDAKRKGILFTAKLAVLTQAHFKKLIDILGSIARISGRGKPGPGQQMFYPMKAYARRSEERRVGKECLSTEKCRG